MIAYAITDSSTLSFSTLEADLEHFASKAHMIVYRDKTSPDYVKNAKEFLDTSKKFDFKKVLLHTDYILANKLQADGVHLNSNQFSEIQEAKELGLFTIISTHSIKEVKNAEKLGADMVTYSPIFLTPNKGQPKGIGELEKVVASVSIPIMALGGIVTEKHIKFCQEAGVYGFASIRYFS
jgi:thiamine-phosphate pyrophosphorylase